MARISYGDPATITDPQIRRWLDDARSDMGTERANRIQRFLNSGMKRRTQRRTVVWANSTPRPAVISTKSRYLSL